MRADGPKDYKVRLPRIPTPTSLVLTTTADMSGQGKVAVITGASSGA